MRPGKKLTTGILPTLLCLLAMLITACAGSGGSTTTNGTHSKAPTAQQVYISDAEVGAEMASWTATCQGKQYFCAAENTFRDVSCVIKMY